MSSLIFHDFWSVSLPYGVFRACRHGAATYSALIQSVRQQHAQRFDEEEQRVFLEIFAYGQNESVFLRKEPDVSVRHNGVVLKVGLNPLLRHNNNGKTGYISIQKMLDFTDVGFQYVFHIQEDPSSVIVSDNFEDFADRVFQAVNDYVDYNVMILQQDAEAFEALETEAMAPENTKAPRPELKLIEGGLVP